CPRFGERWSVGRVPGDPDKAARPGGGRSRRPCPLFVQTGTREPASRGFGVVSRPTPASVPER
ncbi:MAG: hypothetical protein AVDCRST_MAG02-921, partial [uncultured Rubrobacteraceae bacterium]